MKKIDFEKIGKAIYPIDKEKIGNGCYMDRNYIKRQNFTEGMYYGYSMFKKVAYKLLAFIILFFTIIVIWLTIIIFAS
jgi:hypothetical protein